MKITKYFKGALIVVIVSLLVGMAVVRPKVTMAMIEPDGGVVLPLHN